MSRGGSELVDVCTGDACGGVGGGWVDEEDCDTCKGEGRGGRGGKLMDGEIVDTSRLEEEEE